MTNGGKRHGAGRPVGSKNKATLAREALQAYFDQQVVTEFAPIFAHYVRRAKGLKTDADPRILIDFMNRVLGKPPESVQVSGASDGGAVRVIMQQEKA